MANGGAIKRSKLMMGKTAWNKGITNAKASENGKKGADKQSKTVKGRRISIIDGQRKWVYPKKE